jgi:hypothetical protein
VTRLTLGKPHARASAGRDAWLAQGEQLVPFVAGIRMRTRRSAHRSFSANESGALYAL